MKINNKFIAGGLGICLSFAGTAMSYSWFYDNDKLEYKETIITLHQESDDEDIVGDSEADADKKTFTIDIYKDIKDKLKNTEISEIEHKLISLNGVLSKNTESIYFDDNEEIIIHFIRNIESVLKNHDFKDESDFIVYTVSYNLGGERITEEYKITFSRIDKGNEFKAHWTLLKSTTKLLIEDELEEESSEDKVDPPVAEDTLENEKNEAVTLPELGQDNQEESQEPGQIPDDEGEVIPPEEIPESDGTVTLPQELPLEEEN